MMAWAGAGPDRGAAARQMYVGDAIREATEQIVMHLELIEERLRAIEDHVENTDNMQDAIHDALIQVRNGQAKY
jgi:hypothetical protein